MCTCLSVLNADGPEQALQIMDALPTFLHQELQLLVAKQGGSCGNYLTQE